MELRQIITFLISAFIALVFMAYGERQVKQPRGSGNRQRGASRLGSSVSNEESDKDFQDLSFHISQGDSFDSPLSDRVLPNTELSAFSLNSEDYNLDEMQKRATSLLSSLTSIKDELSELSNMKLHSEDYNNLIEFVSASIASVGMALNDMNSISNEELHPSLSQIDDSPQRLTSDSSGNLKELSRLLNVGENEEVKLRYQIMLIKHQWPTTYDHSSEAVDIFDHDALSRTQLRALLPETLEQVDYDKVSALPPSLPGSGLLSDTGHDISAAFIETFEQTSTEDHEKEISSLGIGNNHLNSTRSGWTLKEGKPSEWKNSSSAEVSLFPTLSIFFLSYIVLFSVYVL